jgi:hypothetical protein
LEAWHHTPFGSTTHPFEEGERLIRGGAEEGEGLMRRGGADEEGEGLMRRGRGKMPKLHFAV